MTLSLNHIQLNHLIRALGEEMRSAKGKRPIDADTLFIGGGLPRDIDLKSLEQFGQNKNYKIVFGSVAPGASGAQLDRIDVVLTDGVSDSAILSNGRLWKRNARSPVIIIFTHLGVSIRLSGKDRLGVNKLTGRYHDHGYDLARVAVQARAAKRPGTNPVLTTVGELPIVMDMQTLQHSFEAAA